MCVLSYNISFLSDSESIRSCNEKFLCDLLFLLFSLLVVSDSLQPHRLQHARLPCLLLSPRICSNSCPLSWGKKVKALVIQSCLNLCNPMDCSPPVSSAYGILQARTLEQVAISRRSSGSLPDPDIKPRSPVLQVDSLPSEPPGNPW